MYTRFPLNKFVLSIQYMDYSIKGIHHITAIAGDAAGNHRFYTSVLGLRLVKKTVNFDDPGTYHFYYGNETGAPGTILTFFPWERVRPGQPGAGMVTEIHYAVPQDSLEFWKEKFQREGVRTGNETIRFGQRVLPFRDPDGLELHLVENDADKRKPWVTEPIPAEHAILGFQGAALLLRDKTATAEILEDVFGYHFEAKEGNRYRYLTDAIGEANRIEIIEVPDAPRGLNAGGTNHHIAFRVENEEALMQFREKVMAKGLQITEKIDRNYFYSLYFREPGGVLFEIATDNPGFAIDETTEQLGTALKLPVQYEPIRNKIEAVLPVI